MSFSYFLIFLTPRNFKQEQEPEKNMLNLHLKQCYQTVSSQIRKMNGDFTCSTKN